MELVSSFSYSSKPFHWPMGPRFVLSMSFPQAKFHQYCFNSALSGSCLSRLERRAAPGSWLRPRPRERVGHRPRRQPALLHPHPWRGFALPQKIATFCALPKTEKFWVTLSSDRLNPQWHCHIDSRLDCPAHPLANEQDQLFRLPVPADAPHIALRHDAQVREVGADRCGDVAGR